MLTKEEILQWNDRYDAVTYPTSLYRELVVDQKPSHRKFELLGAWKTGSIRLTDSNDVYTDSYGFKYRFTERWGTKSPVGYSVWIELTNNQEKLTREVPDFFPDSEPEIFREIRQKPGFGFIWSAFVLHGIYPEVYPLYDQHVYRAFVKIKYNTTVLPNGAKLAWSVYKEYRSFFLHQKQLSKQPYWIVDRALWTYGKDLKRFVKKKQPRNSNYKSNIVDPDIIESTNKSWVTDRTLGGKQKSFRWKMDEYCNLIIERKIKKGDKLDLTYTRITSQELDSIFDLVKFSNWVDLANNVQKLQNQAEKDGIGKYLFEHLRWNPTKCQLASHIGSLFTKSGIWNYNEKKIGMKFKRCLTDWKTPLKKYYERMKNAV